MKDLFSVNEEDEILSLGDSLLELASTHVNEKDAGEIVQQLKRIIRYHDNKYYKESTHIITDYQYDQLFSFLKSLEETYPQYIADDSPTRRLSNVLNEDFPTVQHLIPMLSLENSYNIHDLEEFDRRVREALPNGSVVTYAVEPKFDGSSIALVYENDTLVRAATRGNGVEGDEITANTRTIKSVPLSAPFSSVGVKKIELRGECVIQAEVFKQLNIERSKQNEILISEGKKPLELFKNARNTAAGTLRLKDPSEVAKRKLDVQIYQLGYAEDADGNDITDKITGEHAKNLAMLQQFGFNTSTPDLALFTDIMEVEQYCRKWENLRDNYPIDIDGMVVKVNHSHFQQLIGRTSHHPKWAVAFKFKARQATSVLRRVDFQVGRTGAITPVAKIDPVQLMGVEISSVSLHNEDFILEKDIHLGDTVLVERAGDVIPYIAGIVPERRNGTEQIIHFPETCPSCGHHPVKPEGESVWRCIHPGCPAQIEERLIHFVSKGAMNISGLGEEIVRTFVAEGIIQSLTDIYRMDYEKIRQLEGWKDKSVNNLRESVEASKQGEVWRLITGLGIRHVGSTTAKMLALQVDKLTDFKDWDAEKYTHLEDVGPRVAESLYDFFSDEDNIRLLEELESLGVNIQKTEVALASEKLKGLTFLFTGTLSRMSRDQAKDLVEQNGGKALSAISTQLNYLVAGEKAGSKLSKAQKIPSIQIIDEDTFLKMLE